MVTDRPLSWCHLLFGVLLLLSMESLNAQQPDRKKFAITDLAKVDADFQVQGEYLGQLGARRRSRSTMGLQVVALGDGNFHAVGYSGGLPGAGWNGTSEALEMIVNLKSPPNDGMIHIETCVHSPVQYRIQLKDNAAHVYSESGNYLGRLAKIHRSSSTLHLPAPRTATVLFDGQPPENLLDARLTDDGLLMTGTTTAMPVGDFHLHLEFRTPYMPYATGQARGNSGVYIQRRYEVQILDSFGLTGAHNECGALYRQRPPAINMCLPPLSWQTYDIHFTASRWEGGKKVQNAVITVYHNGFPVHDQQEITAKTGAGKPEGPETLPIHLQNHGNPVTFRNIWIDQPSTGSPGDAVGSAETIPCRRRRLLRRRRG